MVERTNASERPRVVGWQFWLRWVLANTVAWGVGGNLLLFVFVAVSFAFRDSTTAGIGASFWWAMFGAVPGAIFGVFPGRLQWLVLQAHITGAVRWVLASAAGWAVGWALVMVGGEFFILRQSSEPEIYEMSHLMGGSWAVIGFVAGVLQWRLLSRQLGRAVWWIVASVLGEMLGKAMLLVVFVYVGSTRGWTVGWIVGGVAYGVITGAVLVWLLRQRVVDSDGAGREAARAEAMGE